MKVIIKKIQEEQKGMLGGNRGILYVLTCRVELTPTEKELVSKGQAESQWLRLVAVGKSQIPELRIGDLLRGVRYETSNLNHILDDEAAIKIVCANLKTILALLASVGSEESYEL